MVFCLRVYELIFFCCSDIQIFQRALNNISRSRWVAPKEGNVRSRSTNLLGDRTYMKLRKACKHLWFERLNRYTTVCHQKVLSCLAILDLIVMVQSFVSPFPRQPKLNDCHQPYEKDETVETRKNIKEHYHKKMVVVKNVF